MKKKYQYTSRIIWTGNNGTGTSRYDEYERSHSVFIEGKPDIKASSDIPFRGDGTKHNPEDFLLSAVASCHMLWYLHLCADAGVIVTDYADNATGIMIQLPTGGGYFESITLHPTVFVKEESMIEKANQLHSKANEKCFIANSLNFKVLHEPNALVQK